MWKVIFIVACVLVFTAADELEKNDEDTVPNDNVKNNNDVLLKEKKDDEDAVPNVTGEDKNYVLLKEKKDDEDTVPNDNVKDNNDVLLKEKKNDEDTVPNENVKVYNDVVSVKSNELDHNNVIEPDDQDTDSKVKNVEEEDGVNFAGPVTAKGTVSVAANFGYNAPGSFSYPSYSSNPCFSPLIPQYFYKPPVPYYMSYSYSPTASLFLPYLENDLEANGNKPELKPNNGLVETPRNVKPKKKPDEIEKFQVKEVNIGKKEVIITITPAKKGTDTPASKDDMKNLVEMLSFEEILANPVVFLDEDFPDYDELEALVDDNTKTDFNTDDKETDQHEERVVFGGFLPAKGSVTIAGRF